MNPPSQILKITRQLRHGRARVFSALTDPVKMSQWFFGLQGGQAKVTNELRPGGRYRIEMSNGQQTAIAQGSYLEIVPPERLVFSWQSCLDGSETRVTIELMEAAGGTKLILTHELREDQVPPHREGWNLCFDHLEHHLDGQPAPAAAKSVS